ncbi:hypothetical protein SSX86_029359 [Deinandra increscens subsp. villosa]|uniref:DUF7792 domain-containing protein n=1 Tax=Deinandra increscens subsp. villosa TaxID=3103831 RepID=A0AAP0C9G4_9ASTR
MDPFIFQSNDPQQQPPPIEQTLTIPLLLTDRIGHAVHESTFYKLECAHLGKQAHRLSRLLRFLAVSTPPYERPVRRICTDITRNLNRTLTLVQKCHNRGMIILRFIGVIGAADFQKVFNLLEASIDAVNWLLDLSDGHEESRGTGSIASIDPSLARVWCCIASLHRRSLSLKVEAAQELSTLARYSDRNKKMIVEEGGIMPLLKLLRDELSPETQIAGATALFHIANDQDMARSIFDEHGVPILVRAFRKSSILVKIEVAKLIARMADHDSVSQKGFLRENVIETLVSGLSSNVSNKKTSKLILELHTSCSRALWMAARGNVANCWRITQTRGLLYLAKLMEQENRDLQINCLLIVVEITCAAENNQEMRRLVFKTNSPAAKAIVDQLLRLINLNQSDNDHLIKILAIRAIGHLARTFSARETQMIISPLVNQLCHKHPDVAIESIIALEKFVCPENYLGSENSKTIIEVEGIHPVIRMLMGDEMAQYHALILLCYIAMQVGNNEEFQESRILTALKTVDKSITCKHTELRDLVGHAIDHVLI